MGCDKQGHKQASPPVCGPSPPVLQQLDIWRTKRPHNSSLRRQLGQRGAQHYYPLSLRTQQSSRGHVDGTAQYSTAQQHTCSNESVVYPPKTCYFQVSSSTGLSSSAAATTTTVTTTVPSHMWLLAIGQADLLQLTCAITTFVAVPFRSPSSPVSCLHQRLSLTPGRVQIRFWPVACACRVPSAALCAVPFVGQVSLPGEGAPGG